MASNRAPSRRTVLLMWLAGALVLIVPIDCASIVRTQEARVLETAREMLTASPKGWLVPHLGGRPRLQKPPLAYWLAAASFAVLGVSEGAGRLPFALAAWATTGLVYAVASQRLGRRAGFLSAVFLAGFVMFARFARLAETDLLVMLFVTVAIHCFWTGLDLVRTGTRERATTGLRNSPAFWFHAGSVAIGLTALGKGLPALFPLLFLPAYAGIQRNWRGLWSSVKCGAPVTALTIGSAWFVYIAVSVDRDVLLHEARVAAMGGGHRGSFLEYFGYLASATLPWTGLIPVALVVATQRARKNRRLLAVLAWLGAILAPLMLAGQKQPHYLLPALPPLAIVTGWYVDRALRLGSRSLARRVAATLFWVAIIGFGLAGGLAPLAGAAVRSITRWYDFAVAAMMLAFATWAIRVVVKRKTCPPVYGCVTTVTAAVLLLYGFWAPTLDPVTSRIIAKQITQTFPDRPLVFYGAADPALKFSLRSSGVCVRDEDALQLSLTAQPRSIVVVEEQDDRKTPAPPLLVQRFAFDEDGGTTRVYETRR